MRPLKITATLRGQIMDPKVHLDGLVAAQLAPEIGLPPIHAAGAELEANLERLYVAVGEVLQRLDGFYAVSDPIFVAEEYDRRHISRRFPTEQAVAIGSPKVSRIAMSTGLSKTFRIPSRAALLRDDKIEWFAVGKLERLLELLVPVTNLGKKRSLGLGRVESWRVQEVEPWEGFPILTNGVPMRPLPPGTPGIVHSRQSLETLTFPYWDHSRKVICAVA